MSALERYHALVAEQLARVVATQAEAVAQAAGWLRDALRRDRFLYVFGTGHSHLLAEEVFYRAGGLARAVPILDEPLMLHQGAVRSTELERQPGYAAELLERYPLAAGDLLVVASNSGRNPVPIELALGARERGARTVALVSRRHAAAAPSRHPSGDTLADVVDLVLDNGGVAGDAALALPGLAQPVGPTSTIVGAFLLHAIVAQAAELLALAGAPPEVYASANLEGSAAHNAALLRRYQGRVPHL